MTAIPVPPRPSQPPMRSVGISVGQLVVEGASLAHWTEAHLHRLVAHFLQVGFGGASCTWLLRPMFVHMLYLCSMLDCTGW